MKLTPILILLLIIFMIFPVIALDGDTYLFTTAQPITTTARTDSHLTATYYAEAFVFTATSDAYYNFYGSGDTALQGHLYDNELQFLRPGTIMADDNHFLISSWLKKGERVYLKIDSIDRLPQDYSVSVVRDDLPFNRIVPAVSYVNVETIPEEITTVNIPLRFYNGGTRKGYVSPAYFYLMEVEVAGLIHGQALFNADTYEIEIDLYNNADATVRFWIGDRIYTDIRVKATVVYPEDEVDPGTGTGNTGDTGDTGNTGDTGDTGNTGNTGGTPTEPDPEPLYNYAGDCTLDNVVDMSDVNALLDVNTLSRFTNQQFDIADVTGNDIVNYLDALMILRRVTGATH